MNGRCYARYGLPANREQQPSYIARANTTAFGIYRPLTERSAMHVRDVLAGAKDDVDKYLQQRRRVSAELVIPNDLGVTFLPRGRVMREMKFKGLLQRGFQLGRMLQAVEENNPSGEVALEVPIGAMNWYGRQERKLVTCFPESPASELLDIETEIVGELLHEAGGGRLYAKRPDHLSCYKYGRSNDNLDLSSRHKAAVSNIVDEHFEAASIESIALGGLVIGTGYSRPHIASNV